MNAIHLKSMTPGVAIVTGGSKRIGKSIVKKLSFLGWKVIIHYNSNKNDALSLQKEIQKKGGAASIIKANLNSSKATEELISKSEKKFGKLTLLVNNASIFENDSVHSLTIDTWDIHNNVNTKAPLLLSQSFAKLLPKKEPGVIINIIDQRVFSPRPDFISYSSSKNSLFWLTKVLAQALSPKIRVCAIGPGPTLKGARQTDNDFKNQSQSVPLGNGSSPEDISQAIEFILNASSFTGQMITLDGGEHLDWIKPEDRNFKD
ncbi:MAG: SDR family oxidoreductase [Alphaproteobacteria bacterium]|nr:SDR family oxidoreductase [Rhodobiaceae bacterium]|tara:strand:- start:310 stop:1092 length:783 start_codon:yes stop_codon:yes gene_type:complete